MNTATLSPEENLWQCATAQQLLTMLMVWLSWGGRHHTGIEA
ncbi:hypothetical protein KR52_05730 [Synechococcus sp. KORDI-52]|nr:hypothetical protein KR52_05730 [Synechococcus sp. KORDI-52]